MDEAFLMCDIGLFLGITAGSAVLWGLNGKKYKINILIINIISVISLILINIIWLIITLDKFLPS